MPQLLLPESHSGFSSLNEQPDSQEVLHLIEQGQYEAALRSLCLAPDSDDVVDNYVLQAVCLIHLQLPRKALDVCDRALAVDSNHPQAWLFRGVACHRLSRWREAYACYKVATGDRSAEHQLNVLSGSNLAYRFPLQGIKSLIKGLFKMRLRRLRLH